MSDTPRTDAAFGQGRHGGMEHAYETSSQLERELNEAKSEVASLKSSGIFYCLQNHELESNLRRAVEIAEEFRYLLSIRHRAEIDAIKATLSEANSLQPKPLTA